MQVLARQKKPVFIGNAWYEVKVKEWKSGEGRETEMDRFKMGEFPHQNIRVELVDMQEKGLPKQGIQIRSQAMLNDASVILKGIKTKETENLPSLFRSTSKKKKKRKISVMTWEKNYKENANLLENSHLKLTISSFR